MESRPAAVRSRAWAEDLCVDSFAAPAALVREDECDIALPEEASAPHHCDMVTLVQERVEMRQLAAD